MYAIIEDSGTQIKVSEGDVIEIDHREGEEGSTLLFDKVLAIGDNSSDDAARVGRPYLDGASVSAEVVEEFKTDKLHVIKFKRRKGYRRKIGHRQDMLRVKIDSISG
ncbi:MAG: 50S ribosomal protein L21 [Planctomycetes bacterium TMED75]|nr:50S ribosomal protein L21 [Planctomycetaceae bacterium]OUU96232.1 MAG: 50S ribosomal protein L21 [Planctomycetes bacterium TMED75]